MRNRTMRSFPVHGALAVLVAVAMLAAAAPSDAQVIQTNTTPFYLYAEGADEWVRTHTAYTYSPMRAADGISKSQATRYILENDYDNMNIILNPASSNIFNLRALNVPHPYCLPASPGGQWGANTLFCNTDTKPPRWLRLVSAQGWVNPLAGGCKVYLQDTNTGLYCSSRPWPSNQAGLICDSSFTGTAQTFHVEI